MIVTTTEFKTNLGEYLEMAAKQDIFILKNGKLPGSPTLPSTHW